MTGEGVGGVDRINFGIGSHPGERVECRRVAAAGEIPAEGVHRKDYDVLFSVGCCADMGLAGRGAACQEDEQQEKTYIFSWPGVFVWVKVQRIRVKRAKYG